MLSSLSISERLQQRFNLLPEKVDEGISPNACSIDEELREAIKCDPELEFSFNLDLETVLDPKKVYKKIVYRLSYAAFEDVDIKKIISTYIKGEMWEKWDDEEKDSFVSENVEQRDEKKGITEEALINKFETKADIYPYKVNDQGIYLEVGADKMDYTVTNTPVVISRIGESLDGDETVQYKIKYKMVTGKIQERFVEPSVLLSGDLKPLIDLGIVFSDNNKGKMKDYFIKYLNPKNPPQKEFTTKKNGWKEEYEAIVTGEYIHTSTGTEKITQLKETLIKPYTKSGNVTEWYEGVKPLLEYDLTWLKMCGTVSAFLIRFVKGNSFVLHNWGESTGGKTTTMQVGASMVGNPLAGGLLQDANNSGAGAELFLVYNSDTPIYFDETSNNPEFSEGLYMMGNGKGKVRGTKDLGYTQGGSWHTVIQSCGEYPLTAGDDVKTGMKMRTVEIHDGIPLLEEEEMMKIEDSIKNNYGLFLDDIVQRVIISRAGYRAMYNRMIKQFEKSKNPFSERVKTHFVILAIGGSILEAVLRKYNIPTKNTFEICQKYYQKAIIEDPTIPYSERALRAVYQWTVRNPQRFERSKSDFGTDGLSKGAYETYGWITKDSIYYDEGVLKDAMGKTGFNFERVKDDWKKDIIEPYVQTDKKSKESKIKSYASPTTINGKRVRGIRIKIKTLADKLSMDEPIFEVPDTGNEKEPDEMNLREKCISFLEENLKYKTVTYTDEDAAVGLIREHDQIELLYGKDYIVQMMAICRKGCRSI